MKKKYYEPLFVPNLYVADVLMLSDLTEDDPYSKWLGA